MLYRGSYWQCAMVIPKGGFAEIKAQGLSGFQARLRTAAGFARDRAEAIKSFDDVKPLTVAIDRLQSWARRGLLCIGDAAHAMSPVGGVGINLAIQDAVAAANILSPVLAKKTPSLRRLRRVQRRRAFPAHIVQRMQVFVQDNILAPTMRNKTTPKAPLLLELVNRWGWIRQWPARLLGIGIRPEHVRSPMMKRDPRPGDSAPT
jgi:2-polyprenyl-6-methoxyphenol hydroxylase-like FAD-dependent oxidoreductase